MILFLVRFLYCHEGRWCICVFYIHSMCFNIVVYEMGILALANEDSLKVRYFKQ